jgi:AcrR family transcriptional regulator
MAKQLRKTAEKPRKSASARTTAESSEGGSRQLRRRNATRTKLLDAARALTLEHPIADIAIAQITERADVGFGSFYNHFTSKEAILEATTEREADALRLAIDRVVTQEPDGAARLASAVRYFVAHSLRDPMWSWFLSNTHYGFVAVRRVMWPSLTRDLDLGRSHRRFDFQDTAAAAEFIIGGTLAVMSAAPSGARDDRLASLAAVLAMRTLGVAPSEIPALVSRRLPPLDFGSEINLKKATRRRHEK